MNIAPPKESIIGWVLAVVAVAVGYVQWGWPGVALAGTVIAFWLLLQFSRALRSMRQAASAPVGGVASAVMMHAKLHAGMRLPQLLALSGSLGRKLADTPETFEWADASGARLQVEMDAAGRLAQWRLERPAEDGAAAP